MNDLFGITTCECAECGKSFERMSLDWTYKIRIDGKVNYYHSYSCWSKALDEMGVKKKPRKKLVRLTADQKRQLFDMLDKGYDQIKIARKLKISKQVVAYYRRQRP